MSFNQAEFDAFCRDLAEHVHERSLFATLRRIDSFTEDGPGLGRSLRPSEDPVRLVQKATMAFATAQMAELTPSSGTAPPALAIYGPGMFGPNGALPVHLTEYALERMGSTSPDFTFWRFVNLFQHRLFSLLFRAWANAQPAVSADRPSDDRFTGYVASLMGMGQPALRQRTAVADHGLFHYVGHFSRQNKSPHGLLALLKDFFGVPARLQQFVGEWLPIPRDARWCLGTRSRAGTLGESATLGGRVFGCQHKFGITLGPLSFDLFEQLLPGGASHRRLQALVRSFSGEEFDVELTVVLKKDEVPGVCLGQAGALGRTSWLATENRAVDADDAVFPSILRDGESGSVAA